jgi:uncharacterized protein YggE
MKDVLKSVIAFTFKTAILLVLLAIFFTGSYFLMLKPAIKSLAQQQVFTIDGTAQKYITPDLALVQVGAYFNDTNAATIKTQADTALNGTTQQLIAAGIPAAKIQSTYEINPKYDSSGENITGYTAHATMSVQTQDFTQVDKILAIAQTNKLNLVDNVSFTLQDPNAAQQQLQSAAISDAQSKAQKMAQETGLSLGKVINISQGYTPYPVYNTNTLNETLIAPGAAKTTGQSSTSGSSDTTAINPGQTQISMTVTLTYEIN